MVKKITSHNQSGGITAENVNVSGNLNTQAITNDQVAKSPRKSTAGKVLGILAAVATIISGIAAVWQIFGVGRQP